MFYIVFNIFLMCLYEVYMTCICFVYMNVYYTCLYMNVYYLYMNVYYLLYECVLFRIRSFTDWYFYLLDLYFISEFTNLVEQSWASGILTNNGPLLQKLEKEILRLKDDGATIILSTHRMESVEEICTHIALINKSKTISNAKSEP